MRRGHDEIYCVGCSNVHNLCNMHFAKWSTLSGRCYSRKVTCSSNAVLYTVHVCSFMPCMQCKPWVLLRKHQGLQGFARQAQCGIHCGLRQHLCTA